MSAVPFFASRCCWILPSGPLNKAHALIRLSTSPCVAALSSKQFLLLLFSLRSICVRSDGMCRHVRARRLSNHPYRGEVVGGRSAVQLPEPPHATDSLCLSCHHIERQLPPKLPPPHVHTTPSSPLVRTWQSQAWRLASSVDMMRGDSAQVMLWKEKCAQMNFLTVALAFFWDMKWLFLFLFFYFSICCCVNHKPDSLNKWWILLMWDF